jgi:hypothetical protein
LIDGRTVRLTGHVHGNNGVKHMYEMRRQLNSVCNPMLGLGEMIYTNDNGSYRVMAYVNNNTYARKTKEFQTLDVSFRCPGGFLESAEQGQFFLAYIEGGLEFPLVTPAEFGMFGYRVEINNDGDDIMPVEMTMDGGGLNPVIQNQSTGAVIRIKKQVHYYEQLYINTDPENREVHHISIDTATNEPNRLNAYGYLSDDSELFLLAPGINVITFNSDDEENKRVRIRGSFRKRYIGV